MEWISVKDRMPEDYQRVLCLFESGTDCNFDSLVRRNEHGTIDYPGCKD